MVTKLPRCPKTNDRGEQCIWESMHVVDHLFEKSPEPEPKKVASGPEPCPTCGQRMPHPLSDRGEFLRRLHSGETGLYPAARRTGRMR